MPTIGSLELMHDLINLSSRPYPALLVLQMQKAAEWEPGSNAIA